VLLAGWAAAAKAPATGAAAAAAIANAAKAVRMSKVRVQPALFSFIVCFPSEPLGALVIRLLDPSFRRDRLVRPVRGVTGE
jgi:hypothetical protein